MTKLDNTKLSERLSDYINSETPGYAFLIEGPWGSGKTHFVDRNTVRFEGELSSAKSKLLDKTRKKTSTEKTVESKNLQKALYVTLNGCGSADDVLTRMFKARYPVADKGGIGDLGLQALQNLGGVDARVYAVKPKGLYIIDDLERCEIPVRETLGIVNDLVEHQGCRVILLSNPDQLRKKAKKIWANEKEKLIGLRFNYVAEADEAYIAFVGGITEKIISEFLLDASTKARLLRIFGAVGRNNLRALKRTIDLIGRVLEVIDVKYRENTEAIQDMVAQLFSYTVAIRSGALSDADIETFRNGDRHYIYTRGDNGSVRTFYSLLEFENLHAKSYFPPKDFHQLLRFDTINASGINNFLNSHASFTPPEERPAWQTVWWGTRATDQAFNVAFQRMKEQWNARSFTEPGEILHVAMLRFRLASDGLLDMSLDQLEASVDEYIRDVGAEGAFVLDQPLENVMTREVFQTYGLAVTGERSRTLFDIVAPELYNRTREKIMSGLRFAEQLAAADWGDKVIAALLESEDAFRDMASFNPRGAGGRFCSYPILEARHAAPLLTGIEGLDENDILDRLGVLANRYDNGHLRRHEQWNKEEEFLVSLRDGLQANTEKTSGITSLRWSHGTAFFTRIIDDINDVV
tara:strand:+ start:2835 stop:4739 length:1905 start_codon:yes stop_codon:yes gene_type:complete